MGLDLLLSTCEHPSLHIHCEGADLPKQGLTMHPTMLLGSLGQGQSDASWPVNGSPFHLLTQTSMSRQMQSLPHVLEQRPPGPPICTAPLLGTAETDTEVKGAVREAEVPVPLGIELAVRLVWAGREDVEFVAMSPPDPAASASAPEPLLDRSETPTPVPTPTPIATSIETTHSMMKNVRLFRPQILSLFFLAP